MFSDLVVVYLFLGGAGAGALAVCCIADLALTRPLRADFGACASKTRASKMRVFGMSPLERTGASVGPRMSRPSDRTGLRMVDLAFLLGFLMLVFAVVCLVADLGRVDRVASLFFGSQLTVLTVGAFSLAALLALAALLVLARFLYLPGLPWGAVRFAEGVAVVVSFAVMAYTGVLLQGLVGVAFWRTPLLPVLFVLSSLSCGAATMCIVAPFSGVEDDVQARILARVAHFDLVVIVLEMAVAACLLWWAHGSAHAGVQESFAILTDPAYGVYSLGSSVFSCWWGGFVLCGLLVPLLAEVAVAFRFGSRRAPSRAFGVRNALAVAAAFVMVGALCMRWAVVQAGQHRDLELQPVQTIQVVPESQAMREADASSSGAFKAGFAPQSQAPQSQAAQMADAPRELFSKEAGE